MSKWRFIGIVLIGALGLFSLLATSETPEPYGYIYLAINPESYATNSIDACINDELILSWNVVSGSTSILSAIPKENISPLLIDRTVDLQGELPITVKGPSKINLLYDQRGSTIYQASAEIRLLPDDLCNGFPIDIRGDYEGTLEQTLPQVASLPRSLSVYLLGNALAADLKTETSSIALYCTTSAQDDMLTCTQGQEEITFKLEGQITSAGFEGTYEGTQKGSSFETNTSGTFRFSKTTQGE
jgi:hypothetical protein